MITAGLRAYLWALIRTIDNTISVNELIKTRWMLYGLQGSLNSLITHNEKNYKKFQPARSKRRAVQY